MIFLAEIVLSKTRYMGETKKKTILRLVQADTEEQAKEKVHQSFTYHQHGGDSCSVQDIDLSEMIE